MADGAVSILVTGPDAAPDRPGLLCVPSIFGANDDLVAQMASLSDVASTVIMDPFWRVEPGAVPYSELDTAVGRLGQLDRSACVGDVAAVAHWLAGRTNGSVVGLGICFGGSFVMLGAASGILAGAVTWHGSRLEQAVGRIDGEGFTAPLRLHFGEVDAITPPEVVQTVRDALAGHPDCRIVVHPGADHGFSHDGPAWDPAAAAAGMADLRQLLVELKKAEPPPPRQRRET